MQAVRCGAVRVYRVSSTVNKEGNDGRQCAEEVLAENRGQPGLAKGELLPNHRNRAYRMNLHPLRVIIALNIRPYDANMRTHRR